MDLQVVQGELAGGLLVELEGNLQLVQLLPQAGKLLEVVVRHLQQLSGLMPNKQKKTKKKKHNIYECVCHLASS